MIPLRNLKRFFYKALRQPLYAFKVLRKRLGAYFSYSFAGGKSVYPESVTLFLTHKCNLHCKMCGQWGEGGVTKKMGEESIKEEMPLEELKKFIDGVSRFRPNITLFGGEPLLYKGCSDLIRYIKKRNMHCLMITNGYMLESMAGELVDSGLDELNVSLDGGQALHDQIRGMPGLFEKIMNGLKAVNHYKNINGKRKPIINIQCTVTKYNLSRLEQMIGVADEARAYSLTFHNLIFTNQDIIDKQKEYDKMLGASSSGWEGFNFTPGIDPAELYKKIESIRSGRHNFTIDLYPNFSEKDIGAYYKNPCYVPRAYPARCISPWITAYVFPDGEMRPCLNSSYSFGNIRKAGFPEIWNGEKAVNFRRILKENKMFPACVRCTELYRY